MASLGNVLVYVRIIHKTLDSVNVKLTIIIGKFSVRPASISRDNDSFNRTRDRHRRLDASAFRQLN
jgi:hypothetical protein